MPTFNYIAIDGEGRKIDGTLEAQSRSEVYRQLEGDRLTPVEVEAEAGGSGESEAADASSESVSVKLRKSELIAFTEELADLLEAELHLQQALAVLVELQAAPSIKQVSVTIRRELREGTALAPALRAASPSFDDLYTNLVAAGEASGSLPRILRRLAENLTLLHELQKKFISALVYPAVMMVACVLLTVVFITVLVPQLSDLLAKTGQDLPMITRVLVAAGGFMASWWWAILLGIAGVFGLFRLAIATKPGRLWWDRVKNRIPLIGPIVETRFLAGFCQALGNLVSNGVPLLPALRLMERATPNRFYHQLLVQVSEDVSAGDGLSTALRKSGHFPRLLADMVSVGEQTGRLGKSLEKATKRFDKELNGRIKRLTGMISPIIIIFLAVVVTVVAYSIVTSIFSAVSGVRSQT